MKHESLWNDDWDFIVNSLGGPAELDCLAREAGAFTRSRQIKSAEDLLRLCFAYGPGQMSLRSASAWAEAVGLAKLSDVALMERLQKSGDWLAALIGRALQGEVHEPVLGRAISLVDGSVVCKAGGKKSGGNGLWRVHAALDLGCERYGYLELTDQHGGERLDRVPVVDGEIRIADRAYLHPGKIAHVLNEGGDVIIRAGWRNASWLGEDGERIDIIEELKASGNKSVRDISIQIGHKGHDPIKGLRLVALRKTPEAAEAAREKARKDARRSGYNVAPETLVAAEWVLLVTSLARDDFPVCVIAKLYRLRWRVEIAFKRLKSLIKFKRPPAKDEALARCFLLAHLLLAVLIDRSSTELLDSPP